VWRSGATGPSLPHHTGDFLSTHRCDSTDGRQGAAAVWRQAGSIQCLQGENGSLAAGRPSGLMPGSRFAWFPVRIMTRRPTNNDNRCPEYQRTAVNY